MEATLHPPQGLRRNAPGVIAPETWLPSGRFEAMIPYILPGYKRPARRTHAPTRATTTPTTPSLTTRPGDPDVR